MALSLRWRDDWVGGLRRRRRKREKADESWRRGQMRKEQRSR